MMQLPTAWTQLLPARRKMLWELAQRPERTVVHMDLTLSRKRMLTALSLAKLVKYELARDRFIACATPEGRALVRDVEQAARLMAGQEVWARRLHGLGVAAE